MKKQRAKDIVLSVVATALVMGTLPTVFATVSEMTIPVTFNDIQVTVDGALLESDKEPFIYEGTTYLPIRAVAEAVGKEVAWDSATKTVILSSGAEEVVEEVEEIEEVVEEVEEDGVWSISVKKNIANANGLKIYCSTIEEVEGRDRYVMNVEMTNSTSMNYGVSVDTMRVNDKLISCNAYAEAVPNSVVKDDIWIEFDNLESVGITEMKTIEVSFKVYNKDDYSESFETDDYKLKISDYE